MSSSCLATVFRQGRAVATNTRKMGQTLPTASKNRNPERRTAAVTMKDKDATSITEKMGPLPPASKRIGCNQVERRKNAAVAKRDQDATFLQNIKRGIITEKFGQALKMFAASTIWNTEIKTLEEAKARRALYRRPLPEGSKRWFQWCAADLKRHMEKMEVKPVEHSFTWSTEKVKKGESYFCDGAGVCTCAH